MTVQEKIVEVEKRLATSISSKNRRDLEKYKKRLLKESEMKSSTKNIEKKR